MKAYILLITPVLLFSCGNSGTKNKSATENISIKKDTCDNPDAPLPCVFLNEPQALTSTMKIADSSEAGQRIKITGQIFKEDGKTPYDNIVIYTYQTDAGGYYSKKGNETGIQKWHGHLYGYCKTDPEGKYEIYTIRPGRYPDNKFPAHIHWVVKEPDGSMFNLNDFVFSDDSLVNKDYLSRLNLKGDSGVIQLKESGNGIQEGSRITILK